MLFLTKMGPIMETLTEHIYRSSSAKRVKAVGLQLSGFFGQKGLPGGKRHEALRDTKGDLVALPPTGSGRANPGQSFTKRCVSDQT